MDPEFDTFETLQSMCCGEVVLSVAPFLVFEVPRDSHPTSIKPKDFLCFSLK
jgi:hypothetical protein